MSNEIRQLGSLLILLGILMAIRYSGFALTKGKKVKQGFEGLEYDEKGNIFIVLKTKLCGFDRTEKYRLKYIKTNENTDKEKMEKWIEEKLNSTKYIFIPLKNALPFQKGKTATIFIRDTSEAFQKVPIRFLPRTEIQNLIVPLVKLGFVETQAEDFSTFGEMLSARKLKKEEGIEILKNTERGTNNETEHK